MKASLYHIRQIVARGKKIPMYFEAVELKATEKAVYLYGRGTTKTTELNVCCICGRELTHPVSKHLGIGPECGSHFHINKTGFTLENLKLMQQQIKAITIEGWFPKSIILEKTPIDTVIPIPGDVMKKAQTKAKKKSIAKITNAIIEIEFEFNRELIAEVKKLPGAKYLPKTKSWSCSTLEESISKLKALHFEMEDLRISLQVKGESGLDKLNSRNIAGIKRTLFPYQAEGVDFIERVGGNGLIADEMGLGKTIQALAYLQLHPELRPALIVVPASLKRNWQREIEMTMSTACESQLLNGKKNYQLKGDIFIINFDIVADWAVYLSKINVKIMIVDEIHKIKNNKAKRTKAVKWLKKRIPQFIGLSGTPITNRPVEFYNAIEMINPDLFGNFWKFGQRYCDAKNTGFGWDFSGATNTDELHKLLTQSIMIRRLKKDVLKDLPDKIRSYVPIELTNSTEYNRARKDFLKYVEETKSFEAAEKAAEAETLTMINTLRQLAVEGKMKQLIEWIKEFLETDEKLVLFAVHKATIDLVMQEFGELAVKIDGSVSNVNRDEAVQQFQNNPKIKLFVGNIQAAGVGLTLTASSNVAFMELPWTPGELLQAEDRCHRIGQKNAVNVYYLLAAGTIEEDMAKLLDSKRMVLDSVLDGKITETTSLLQDLMGLYQCKETSDEKN